MLKQMLFFVAFIAVGVAYPPPYYMQASLYFDANNYEEAKNYCELSGGHLPTPTSQIETDRLIAHMDGSSGLKLWLGLRKSDNGSKVVVDNANGTEVMFNNWSEEPNNDNAKMCIILQQWSGKWDEADCSQDRGSSGPGMLCEFTKLSSCDSIDKYERKSGSDDEWLITWRRDYGEMSYSDCQGLAWGSNIGETEDEQSFRRYPDDYLYPELHNHCCILTSSKIKGPCDLSKRNLNECHLLVSRKQAPLVVDHPLSLRDVTITCVAPREECIILKAGNKLSLYNVNATYYGLPSENIQQGTFIKREQDTTLEITKTKFEDFMDYPDPQPSTEDDISVTGEDNGKGEDTHRKKSGGLSTISSLSLTLLCLITTLNLYN